MPGLEFDVRVRNIRDAAEIGKTTGAQILTGLVVMECNLEDLEAYVRFVADLGVERVILQKLYPGSSVFPEQSVTVHRSPEEIEEHVGRAFDAAMELGIFVETNLDEIFGDPRNRNPQSSRFDFLQDNAGVVELFRPGFCISTATTVLVEWDGTLLPCCRDHYDLGNINESSFADLWNGERMKRLRASFFEGERREFCTECMAFFNEHA
jgi:radical SAM protein with 4Fe4S-binding SPASM domain